MTCYDYGYIHFKYHYICRFIKGGHEYHIISPCLPFFGSPNTHQFRVISSSPDRSPLLRIRELVLQSKFVDAAARTVTSSELRGTAEDYNTSVPSATFVSLDMQPGLELTNWFVPSKTATAGTRPEKI